MMDRNRLVAAVGGLRKQLIGHWPFNEASGTTAYDVSGFSHNGSYSGVTLGEPGMGDGGTSIYFDGTNNDTAVMFSSALASRCRSNQGSLSIWVKADSISVWRDGQVRRILHLVFTPGDSLIEIYKNGAGGIWFAYKINGTFYETTSYILDVDDWVHIGFAWANGLSRFWINGVRPNLDRALGAFAHTLASYDYGQRFGQRWYGWMAHGKAWNYALTDGQMRQEAGSNYPGFKGVCITFDDGTASQFTAEQYAVSKGVTGTVYQITNNIDVGGSLTSAQLITMDGDGWLVANHSASHVQFATISEAEQETELSTAAAALTALGLTRGAKHVAYPYGSYNADTFTAMAATGMLTGRIAANNGVKATEAQTQYQYFLNLSLYAGMDRYKLAEMKTAILDAIERGGYCIILFHSFVVSGAVNDQWNYADFYELCDWLDANSIPTKTIADLYADH